jgi:hypothetical protein
MQKQWLEGIGPDGEVGMGLNTIIAKINSTFGEMFSEMNITGEVKLKESKINDDDDFENYGLSILVMFR